MVQAQWEAIIYGVYMYMYVLFYPMRGYFISFYLFRGIVRFIYKVIIFVIVLNSHLVDN